MYVSDLKHPNETLEEKLHHLYGLNRAKKIDLSFRPPFLQLLEKFGNPQDSLPPIIHVAGTNGKGSIIAFLRAILEASGKTVHAYTSPHLQRFNERIILAGQEIEDDALEALIDEALEHNNGEEVTFFEITTAIALAAFTRTPADYILLEVGLGGRLDCTNIIDKPAVTIINAIGYDHTEYLGKTLPEIAVEKAGIMKQGIPCVIGPQTDEAIEAGVIDIFQSHAEHLNIPLYILHSANLEGVNYSLSVFDAFEAFDGFETLALIGNHQRRNAQTALKALEILGLKDSATAKAGLANVSWRARLQDITEHFDTPTEWEIYLDGGHNENAAQALASQAEAWEKDAPKPLHLVLGMMAHKDPMSYLRPLLPHIKSLSLLPITEEDKSFSPDQLRNILNDNNIRNFDNVQSAINTITTETDEGRLLIGGSMYLAGDILNQLSK